MKGDTNMSFVDEIYAMYKNRLTGTEEDAVALVLNLLEDHSKSDLLSLIKKMEDEEVYQMVAMYLIEILKLKMAQEGVGGTNFKTATTDYPIH